MKYDGQDVDNADIRQLHSYSYYYYLKYGDKFKGAGLIYPAKEHLPNDMKNIDYIYGIDTHPQKFGVFTIKDPSENETIMENENYFIQKLREFIDGE